MARTSAVRDTRAPERRYAVQVELLGLQEARRSSRNTWRLGKQECRIVRIDFRPYLYLLLLSHRENTLFNLFLSFSILALRGLLSRIPGFSIAPILIPESDGTAKVVHPSNPEMQG
jgi:hypothetical protein